ncbi:MAG: RHS repeat-associated core domain-containing protein [Acidimicrobiales bacterium]
MDKGTNFYTYNAAIYAYDVAVDLLVRSKPTTVSGVLSSADHPVSSNMRARWYDTQSGVFTSVDPAVSSTNQPYQFANGDPVNNSDPSGDGSMVPVTVQLAPYGGSPVTLQVDSGAYWIITRHGHGASTANLMAEGADLVTAVYLDQVQPVPNLCPNQVPSVRKWLSSMYPFFIEGYIYAQATGGWPDYLNTSSPVWVQHRIPLLAESFMYWAYWNLDYHPQNAAIVQVLAAYAASNGSEQSALAEFNAISLVSYVGQTGAPEDG